MALKQHRLTLGEPVHASRPIGHRIRCGQPTVEFRIGPVGGREPRAYSAQQIVGVRIVRYIRIFSNSCEIAFLKNRLAIHNVFERNQPGFQPKMSTPLITKYFGEQVAVRSRRVMNWKREAGFGRRGCRPQFPSGARIERENIADAPVDLDREALR